MKILQVNCVYKKDSTGKIMYDIHTELKKNNIESVVCYGRGKNIKEENVYKTSFEIIAKFNNLLSRFTGMMYGGCFFATNKLIKIIKTENPDIVILHCVNGFFVNIYRLIKFLNKNNIKTILVNHGEFMYTANCGHSLSCDKWKNGCGDCPMLRYATNSYLFDRTHKSWLKMKKAFAGFKNLYVVGASNWITKRAKQSVFFSYAKFSTVHNGIDTENIFHTGYDVDSIKTKYGIPDNKKIILHVTFNFNSGFKGGEYVRKLAENTSDKYYFVVVGCEETEKDINDKILFIEHTKDQKELAAFYCAADCLIITSKCENYPTVCLEAVSCGTPVVGFDVGGIFETIPSGMGETVEYGDIEILKEKVIYWADVKNDISIEVIEKAKIYNSKKRMIKEYIELFNQLLEEH